MCFILPVQLPFLELSFQFAESCSQPLTEVVHGGHEFTLCLYFHLGRHECPCSRELPTVPNLLFIIIIELTVEKSFAE